MAPIDLVVLAVIGIAFVAVCVRIYRKGTCADCAQGGVCTGHCSNKKTCAALKGVDKIAEDLGRGIHYSTGVWACLTTDTAVADTIGTLATAAERLKRKEA